MSQVAAGSEKVDPLRQQLDELDQLMERMLALGVQSAPPGLPDESVRQPQIAPAKVEMPAEPIIEQMQTVETLSTSPAEYVPPVEAPYYPELFLNSSVAEPATASLAQAIPNPEPEPGPEVELAPRAPSFVSLDAGSGAPAAPLFADFQFAPPPSIPSLDPAPLPVLPRISASVKPVVIVAWWLQPLGVVNRIYDGSTGWLGPIGRGLQSRPMRNLLGICGLACMLGALAWMLWEGTDWNS